MADLDTFDFIGYEIRTVYPKGVSIQFGRGYESCPEPSGKEPRTFYLDFQGMGFYVDETGAPSYTVEPTKNILTLEQFYLAHKFHVNFTITHYMYGDLTVRFSKAFQCPKIKQIGGFMSEPFELEIKEIV